MLVRRWIIATQPEHGAIIAAESELRREFRAFEDNVLRRLGAQEAGLNMLKTAHNVVVGKGVASKLLVTTIPGALGAGIVPLVDRAPPLPPQPQTYVFQWRLVTSRIRPVDPIDTNTFAGEFIRPNYLLQVDPCRRRRVSNSHGRGPSRR